METSRSLIWIVAQQVERKKERKSAREIERDRLRLLSILGPRKIGGKHKYMNAFSTAWKRKDKKEREREVERKKRADS